MAFSSAFKSEHFKFAERSESLCESRVMRCQPEHLFHSVCVSVLLFGTNMGLCRNTTLLHRQCYTARKHKSGSFVDEMTMCAAHVSLALSTQSVKVSTRFLHLETEPVRMLHSGTQIVFFLHFLFDTHFDSLSIGWCLV